VDDGWAGLVVLLLGDPHLLEGGEGSKDGSSDPDGVFPLGGSNDLDLHGGWSKSSDLLLHSVGNTGEHGGASGKDVVGVEILTDVDVALHDGVVGGLVDTGRFHTNEGWLEEGLGTPEALVSDGDDLTVGKLVALLEGGGGGGGGHFLLEVQGNIAKFFFDVSNDLTFSGGDEGVASFSEDFHQVVGEVSASKIHTGDCVGKGVTLINWDIV